MTTKDAADKAAEVVAGAARQVATTATAEAVRSCSSSSVVRVQVIYAKADEVWDRMLELPVGSRVSDALALSQFAQHFPDYPMTELAIGIYGQACELDRFLADRDRIEIYRKLSFDPMESRRRRAVHRQAFMTKPKNRPKRRKAKLMAQDRES